MLGTLVSLWSVNAILKAKTRRIHLSSNNSRADLHKLILFQKGTALTRIAHERGLIGELDMYTGLTIERATMNRPIGGIVMARSQVKVGTSRNW